MESTFSKTMGYKSGFGTETIFTDNPVQNKPQEKEQAKKCICKVHSPARNFNQLVVLVKDAEDMLITNGVKKIAERINTIRGIYYGTEWSFDYQKEKSKSRNDGFYLFTGFTKVTIDARKVLKCSDNCKSNLFQALFDTPEVVDSSIRVTDFGHLIIGLDARRSFSAKNIPLQIGGTGLENCTWVGDLGGGVGMLAFKRASNPKIRAKDVVFQTEGHDYGCSINIEGDIAAYVCGMNAKNSGDISDSCDNFTSISSMLNDFFNVKWKDRVICFLKMLGAEYEKEEVSNKDEVLSKMTSAIESFSKLYILTRAVDKKYDKNLLKDSLDYIPSASIEVANMFYDGLIALSKKPTSAKFSAVTNPEPTKIEKKTETTTEKAVKEIVKKLETLIK